MLLLGSTTHNESKALTPSIFPSLFVGTSHANSHSPGSSNSSNSSSSSSIGASSSGSSSGGIEKARLCLPGRVVHMVKSDQDGFFCLAKAVYNPMHAPR